MDYLQFSELRHSKTDELRHHGIIGMKWGVRRYQNKDGTLTAAGKKRYAKLQSQLKQLEPASEKTSPPEKKNSISDLSNEELKSKTDRLNLEKNYMDAISNHASSSNRLNPPAPESRAKALMRKIANKTVDEIIIPEALNIGKTYLNKFTKDKFGFTLQVGQSQKNDQKK